MRARPLRPMLNQEPQPQMPPEKNRPGSETEKGFGTGLRAQLERRKEFASNGTALADP
jgi:hypothetical protein